MCTAVTFKRNHFYFGRNLDLEFRYREEVTVTPRRYPFIFRNGTVLNEHYAMIGMATLSNGYPLYYEATNEKGLSIAGLNFPGNAVYNPLKEHDDNIAPFEVIPWLLCRAATADEALAMLERLNIWDISFSDEFPNTPLHWLMADREKAVTIEPTADGIRVYDNPFGVLTNNPPFCYHRHNIANYMNLTTDIPKNRFHDLPKITPYSLGMGAIGLPGDVSSASRFVRAVFLKFNSVVNDDRQEVAQFFHILKGVSQIRGMTVAADGRYEYTVYSSCCDADSGVYYYTTYENSCITAVDMYETNLDGDVPRCFPMVTDENIRYENRSGM